MRRSEELTQQARKIADAIVATGHSHTLLHRLRELGVERERVELTLSATAPERPQWDEKKIRAYLRRNV